MSNQKLFQNILLIWNISNSFNVLTRNKQYSTDTAKENSPCPDLGKIKKCI